MCERPGIEFIAKVRLEPKISVSKACTFILHRNNCENIENGANLKFMKPLSLLSHIACIKSDKLNNTRQFDNKLADNSSNESVIIVFFFRS